MTRAEEFDLAVAARDADQARPRIVYPDTTPRAHRGPSRSDRVDLLLSTLADQRRARAGAVS